MDNFSFEELQRRRVANLQAQFTNAEELQKGEDSEMEKARHGVYADTAQNRRLNRVGQEYGHKAEEKQPSGQRTKKTEEASGGGGKTVADHAANTDSKVLQKVVDDPKAKPELKEAAKSELEKRGEGSSEKSKQKGSKKDYEDIVEKMLDKKDDSVDLYNDTIRIWGSKDGETKYDVDDKYGEFEVKEYLGYLYNFKNASDKDLQRISKPTKSWGKPEYVAAIKKAYNEIKSKREQGDPRYQSEEEPKKPKGREKTKSPVVTGVHNIMRAIRTNEEGIEGSFVSGENALKKLGVVRSTAKKFAKTHPEIADMSVEDIQELINPDNYVDNVEKYGKSFEKFYDAADEYYSEAQDWNEDDDIEEKLERVAKRAGKDVIDALREDQGGLLTDKESKKKLKEISSAAENFVRNNPDLQLTDEDWEEIVNGDPDDLKRFEIYEGFEDLNTAIENYF